MSKRHTILGFAALCTLTLGVFPASSAFAGTTAFTCVSGAGAANTNADCEPGSTGTSGHEAIAEGTSTTATYNKLTNPVLTGKLFGAPVELQATGAECVSCSVANKEVGGVMEVTGAGGQLKFTGVTAVGLPKCVVNGGSITTEKLKFTSTSVAGLTLEPETGTTLAKFSITGSECTVAGSNITVTGRAFGSLNGAKLTFNVTKASEELKLEGEKAAFTGTGTVEVGEGVTHHPVALT
jgi:hypothetical protein